MWQDVKTTSVHVFFSFVRLPASRSGSSRRQSVGNLLAPAVIEGGDGIVEDERGVVRGRCQLCQEGGKRYATFETGFRKCCEQIEAHAQSRARDADVPPPDEILRDIQILTEWTASLRVRQKSFISKRPAAPSGNVVASKTAA